MTGVLFTPWKIAMALILPLMAGRQRIRTWGAMIVASFAAWAMPTAPMPAYIAIDLLAGALVLIAPAGFAQRLIGLLFACMVMFHAGFLFSIWWHHYTPSVDLYLAAQKWVGWAQWAVLLGWGLVDAWEYLAGRLRPRRREMASAGRI